MFHACADFMGFGWTPVAGLLKYKPTPIVEELVKVVIEDPCGILATLIGDNTVTQRVLEQRRRNVTCQTFIRDIFHP